MRTPGRNEALVEAIERRLTDISGQQHALAVEKARLLEQLTPLRLGTVAPDTVVVELKSKGITLRGLTAVRSAARRPRPAVLKALVSIRPAGAPLPLDRSTSPRSARLTGERATSSRS